MKEIWRDVIGFKGRYEVSNLGRVKSLIYKYGKRKVPKYLKPCINHNGYAWLNILKNGYPYTFRVHRLVAFAFIGKPKSDKLQINHKDGNKLNNTPANLEWVTASQNCRHYLKTLKTKKVRNN